MKQFRKNKHTPKFSSTNYRIKECLVRKGKSTRNLPLNEPVGATAVPLKSPNFKYSGFMTQHYCSSVYFSFQSVKHIITKMQVKIYGT